MIQFYASTCDYMWIFYPEHNFGSELVLNIGGKSLSNLMLYIWIQLVTALPERNVSLQLTECVN